MREMIRKWRELAELIQENSIHHNTNLRQFYFNRLIKSRLISMEPFDVFHSQLIFKDLLTNQLVARQIRTEEGHDLFQYFGTDRAVLLIEDFYDDWLRGITKLQITGAIPFDERVRYFCKRHPNIFRSEEVHVDEEFDPVVPQPMENVRR